VFASSTPLDGTQLLAVGLGNVFWTHERVVHAP
jgi:hypothetical protein